MKILAIQNRMGIGDTVLFLPFIKALSKKFNTPIDILVKENSKADQYLYDASYINKIIILDRGNKSNGKHNGLLGSFRLIKDLKKYKFDKVFIFNSSLRYNLIAKFSKIPEIYQYPLLQKKYQHITETPKKFIKDKLGLEVNDDPCIEVNEKIVINSALKYKIDKEKTNILLGIGGSGPTKRIPANTFLNLIKKISKIKKCNFFIATGKKNDEQVILKEIINSRFRNQCTRLDDLSIKETLPVIKNCDVSICNDSSFSHLSAALGVKTITLMADTPLTYGNYSTKMFPIIPDGVKEVSHGTLGKNKINSEKIFEKLIEILN
jgi:heptosyltransferase II